VIITVCAISGCVLTGDLVTRQLLVDAAHTRNLDVPLTQTPVPTAITLTPSLTPTQTPAPGRVLASVRRVLDGNTIELDGGYVVRYIGVDTPGAGMFGRPVEPFGREAADRNVDLVEGKIVELEADSADVDGAGAQLRYVYLGGIMVNQTLLNEGLARLAPFGRNTRYQAQLQAAQADAKDRMVNIWTLITSTPRPTLAPSATPLPTDTALATPTRLPTALGIIVLPANVNSPLPSSTPLPRPSATLIGFRAPGIFPNTPQAPTPRTILLTSTPTR